MRQVSARTRRASRAEGLQRLRSQLPQLEQHFLRPTIHSNKLLLQQEIGYMRRALDAKPLGVDVTYPVNAPYAFVQIRFDAETGEYQYRVHEPTLDPGEPELLLAIRKKMESITDQEELPQVDISRLDESPEIELFLWGKFLDVLDLYDFEVDPSRRRSLYYYIHRDMIGYGPADPVLRDPFVEDVSCNGHGVPLFVFHRVFGSLRTNVSFQNEHGLNKYILMLAQSSGKHVSIYQPILDATMSDGSRINLTLGTEVTKKGSTFSIRKFASDPITPIDLVRFGSMGTREFAWFWHLIQNKRSILVSGGTASGKTTLLNAISMFLPSEDKVVSIEDTPEIHLNLENWIPSVSRAGYASDGKGGGIELFDLLVAALRQRPEYILVGEVRGREAFTLFQAISTGHAAMATIHAADVDELLNRIENDPMNIPRALLQSLDAVVFPGQVTRQGKRLRRVTAVTEILEMDPGTGNLLTNEVFRWDAAADGHQFLGRSFILENISRSTGRSMGENDAELSRKARYLDLLLAGGCSNQEAFCRAIQDYYLDPEAAVMRWEEPTH